MKHQMKKYIKIIYDDVRSNFKHLLTALLYSSVIISAIILLTDVISDVLIGVSK